MRSISFIFDCESFVFSVLFIVFNWLVVFDFFGPLFLRKFRSPSKHFLLFFRQKLWFLRRLAVEVIFVDIRFQKLDSFLLAILVLIILPWHIQIFLGERRLNTFFGGHVPGLIKEAIELRAFLNEYFLGAIGSRGQVGGGGRFAGGIGWMAVERGNGFGRALPELR